MALRVIMARKRRDNLVKQLKELRDSADFEKREQELETAINELSEESTQEEQDTLNEEVEKLEEEKEEHNKSVKELEDKIAEVEEEIRSEEEKQPKPNAEPKTEEREDVRVHMNTRTKFFGMNMQERDAFFAREEVKNMIESVRTCVREKRAIDNVGLTIPTVTLPLIEQIVDENSKLTKYVKEEKISGNGRQTIMGTNPEGIWMEMYATLNELELGFNNVEVDGYKVGGFFSIENAILEDNDVDLVTKLFKAIGISIAKAKDKAIVYGKGVKMPLGFVTRLVQTSKPSDWSETRREWKDLHNTNVITIKGKNGLELFKEIIRSLKVIKNDYSSDNLVWIMNKNTHLDLQIEAMNTNMAAAIVSGMGQDTMPVVGGRIEELEFMNDGDIAFGYMGLYLLAQRKEMKLGQSEHYKFIEDRTIFKGTARADGKPVICEAFGILNIRGVAPATEILFPLDKANTSDVQLEKLKIGALSLFPAFNPKTYEYMLNTTSASNKVEVQPAKSGATVVIKKGAEVIENGSNATWDDGENILTITVTYAGVEKTYSVKVTKTATTA